MIDILFNSYRAKNMNITTRLIYLWEYLIRMPPNHKDIIYDLLSYVLVLIHFINAVYITTSNIGKIYNK